MWIDTHCHLDAPEFGADRAAVVQRAQAAGVARLVLPAVQAADFEAVRALAQTFGAAYALGIHPLYVDRADEADLDRTGRGAHLDHAKAPAVGHVGEATADRILLELKPHLHAKGTDYSREGILERETVLSYGGDTVIVGDPKNHSSSRIIDTIRGWKQDRKSQS